MEKIEISIESDCGAELNLRVEADFRGDYEYASSQSCIYLNKVGSIEIQNYRNGDWMPVIDTDKFWEKFDYKPYKRRIDIENKIHDALVEEKLK